MLAGIEWLIDAAGCFPDRLQSVDCVRKICDQIIFDLELTGEQLTSNQSPVVNAGPDQSITLPAFATLNGSISEDALPPPGVLTLGWSKLSGPGTVTFGSPNSPNTTAGFTTDGSYVLRLTASDGLASTSDDLAVSVNASSMPLRIESAVWFAGPRQVFASPSLRSPALPTRCSIAIRWRQEAG